MEFQQNDRVILELTDTQANYHPTHGWVVTGYRNGRYNVRHESTEAVVEGVIVPMRHDPVSVGSYVEYEYYSRRHEQHRTVFGRVSSLHGEIASIALGGGGKNLVKVARLRISARAEKELTYNF